MVSKCRFCQTPLNEVFIDLNSVPPSNSYLTLDQLNKPETYFPLKVMVCSKCFLVQTIDFVDPAVIFSSEYAYFSSFSTTWVEHSRLYVDKIINVLKLGSNSMVIEIACNDGYLLQFFQKANIPCLGIEPSGSTAEVAREKGIEVLVEFFGHNLADSLPKADLIIGNNVIAHVPDINDFVGALKKVLKPSGTANFEFPHLLQLIQKSQFDTIYHEHFSYFSLQTIINIFEKFDLKIYNVETLETHGGSLRIYAAHKEFFVEQNPNVDKILAEEYKNGLNSIYIYKFFQKKAIKIKNSLLKFLINATENDKKVYGYGAAAKGNTLLNYAGVKKDLLPLIVDKSPHKQGLFMPQSHIPITSGDVFRDQPDYVLILPWNIKDEISTQLQYLKEKGTKFVVAIPSITIF
ncbi:MAG: class I SAM-dependent methyltransferase [Deltaproteobacteria bacterium]|jgi:SAM-dependent methyltransferase|nr:class I SAM-dependent methyltransferase [Deltaproteobacteria bacterium]